MINHLEHASAKRWWSASVVALFLSGSASVAATGDTLDSAVRSSGRTPAFVARDGARHPLQELRFAGITSRSSVIEIWPGGGYWTEILAPYLRDHGRYTMAIDVPNGEPEGQNFALGPTFAKHIADDPARYGDIRFALFGKRHPRLDVTGGADIVLTFRNLHNWMREAEAPTLLAGIHAALKPGGVLLVEEHRARPDRPQDPKADDGYVRQDYAIRLIERAGFKLIASSELLANPRDTTHWIKGVWTLPPTYALGNVDRAKYEAVGEADNFLLKFRRTG